MTHRIDRIVRALMQGACLIAGCVLVGYGTDWRVGLGLWLVAGTLSNQLVRVERMLETGSDSQ